MRVNPLVAAFTLAVLTLAPSECGSAGGNNPPRGSSSSRIAPGQPSSAVRIATDATCPVMGDLEGKFTRSSQMDDYLACLVPGVEQWIDADYSRKGHPDGYYFVPLAVTGNDGKCEYDDATLAYCPSSGRVYFGERAVWSQYTQHGDAASAVILAHEVTHHFQNLAHVPPATVPRQQIRYENQADCGAGAFSSYAQQQGWFVVKDDIVDVGGSLAAAGAVPGPDRDHGSAPERLAAFGRGFISGDSNPLRSCNRYVPETPLVS